jgi:hypothetical protein
MKDQKGDNVGIGKPLTVGLIATWVEEGEPSLRVAVAGLVITTHEDPGGAAEEGCSRRKEIRVPGRPVVAVRAALATGIVRGAGTFPVEIIADVDDEVRVPAGNRLGNLRKGPGLGIVAGLIFFLPVIDTATGVADDGNASNRALRKRQILVEYRCHPRAERDSRLTRDNRERV